MKTKNLAGCYRNPRDLNSYDKLDPPFNWAGYWSARDPGARIFGAPPPPVGLERSYKIPVPNPGGIDVEKPGGGR